MDASAHREQLLTRPTTRSLTTEEVANVERARADERRAWQDAKAKQAQVEHRVAGHKSQMRLNSRCRE